MGAEILSIYRIYPSFRPDGGHTRDLNNGRRPFPAQLYGSPWKRKRWIRLEIWADYDGFNHLPSLSEDSS